MNSKSNFINRSFKRQLFFWLLLVTLLLVIVGGAFTLQGFQTRIKADYQRQDEWQDKSINEKLQNALTLSETTIDAVEKDEVLVGAFSAVRRDDQEIYTQLYNETSLIREFATVDLYANDRCIYSTNQAGNSSSLPLNYSILREANVSRGKTVYSLDPNNAEASSGTLLLARQITNGYIKGVVVVRLQQDEISELLSGQINSKDGFILTNQYLRPFCQLGTAKDGSYLEQIRSNMIENKLYNDSITPNVYMSELGDTGLLSIYITPQPLEDSAIQAGYQIIGILAIISVIVCFLLATGLSEYFSSPITKLNAAMKRFRKGDFDTKIELNRSDEFEQLATGFNKMTRQLKQTMEEQVLAERKINETRIAMMQSQLNPHFLYNTLDTIKWVAKANQVPEVATLSSSLAGILRMSISAKQFCTLEEELKLVERYCDIQKIRFDDFFDLIINVPDELKCAVVPKLILQPLVENAIIHGLEDRDDGRLFISSQRDDSELLKIFIEDNGKGISDEMIDIIESDDISRLEGHLGLNNVNTIIKLYYGKSYGITAERLEAGGTRMTITLPFQEKEPIDDQSNDCG